jgi:hypothetical protein
MLFMRRLTPTLLAALAALLLPATAFAGMSQESIFEDEYLLLTKGDISALDEMSALGADTVRSIVYWQDVAPSPKSSKAPRGFKASSVTAYPASGWNRYDDMVRGADARGLKVLLTPSGPVPRWASECRGSATAVRACKPKVNLYEGFVHALATRYSGAYADEDQGGGVLPRVDRWSIWNEPNQPGWLNPQYVKSRGKTHLWAADRYRSLAAAGVRALRASGHRSDRILLGETAPIGRSTGKLAKRASPPVPFIAQLFCLDARGRKLRGAASKAAGCRKFKRLGVNGFAHHPYTRGGSQPPLGKTLSTEITIATPSRLRRLLDRGGSAGTIPRRLPVWYTEFGYQTNPPDRLFGVSLSEQAAFINQADYLASRDKRVRSVAQYKLVDEQDQASFQTGLVRYGSLRHKPAYAAYQLPIWAVRKGRFISIYGQVRPAAARSAQNVEIQNAPKAGGAWRTVKTVTVKSLTGQFVTRTAAKAGFWRLRWTPSIGGKAKVSRVARAGRR